MVYLLNFHQYFLNRRDNLLVFVQIVKVTLLIPLRAESIRPKKSRTGIPPVPGTGARTKVPCEIPLEFPGLSPPVPGTGAGNPADSSGPEILWISRGWGPPTGIPS
jgi:hypothetical protein